MAGVVGSNPTRPTEEYVTSRGRDAPERITFTGKVQGTTYTHSRRHWKKLMLQIQKSNHLAPYCFEGFGNAFASMASHELLKSNS
jgi:hypothetical protein